jgi:hypothetical protein
LLLCAFARNLIPVTYTAPLSFSQTPVHELYESQNIQISDEAKLFSLFIFGLKYAPAIYYSIVPSFEKDFLSLETFALSIALNESKSRVKKFSMYESELTSLEEKKKRFQEYYSALAFGNKKTNFLSIQDFPTKMKNVFWEYNNSADLSKFWLHVPF